MNLLGIYDGLRSMFPRIIRVTYVNHLTKEVLETIKVDATLLPARFDKPTFIEYKGEQWRILKATPENDDYLIFKKLRLEIARKDWEWEGKLPYVTQSISLLPTCSFQDNGKQAILRIDKQDWQSVQLINEHDLDKARELIEQLDKEYERPGFRKLEGFEHCVERPLFDPLMISGNEFLTGHGPIEINELGIVTNGFAVAMDGYYLYGQHKEEIIWTLSLYGLEHITEEIFNWMGKYKLVLVNWVNRRLYSFAKAELEEEVKP